MSQLSALLNQCQRRTPVYTNPIWFRRRRAQVNKIRDKCQKQEETIHDMEGEVESKRGELQKLKDEETSLEREYENNKRELDNVSHSLQDTKLQISQVGFCWIGFEIVNMFDICGVFFISLAQIKSMVTQLQESQRQMSDALAVCKSAIETNNPSVVSDYTLKLEPEFREIRRALEKKDVRIIEQQETVFSYDSNHARFFFRRKNRLTTRPHTNPITVSRPPIRLAAKPPERPPLVLCTISRRRALAALASTIRSAVPLAVSKRRATMAAAQRWPHRVCPPIRLATNRAQRPSHRT